MLLVTLMLLHEDPVSGSGHAVIISIGTRLKFGDQTGRSQEPEDTSCFHYIAFWVCFKNGDALLSLQMDTIYFAFTLPIFTDPSVKYLNLSLKDATKIKSNFLGSLGKLTLLRREMLLKLKR